MTKELTALAPSTMKIKCPCRYDTTRYSHFPCMLHGDFFPRPSGRPRASRSPVVFASPRLWPLDPMMRRIISMFLTCRKTQAAISFASRRQRKSPSNPRSRWRPRPPSVLCVAMVKVFRRDTSTAGEAYFNLTVESFVPDSVADVKDRHVDVQSRTRLRFSEGEGEIQESISIWRSIRVGVGRFALGFHATQFNWVFVSVDAGTSSCSDWKELTVDDESADWFGLRGWRGLRLRVSLSFSLRLHEGVHRRCTSVASRPLYSRNGQTDDSVNVDMVGLLNLDRRSTWSLRGFQSRRCDVGNSWELPEQVPSLLLAASIWPPPSRGSHTGTFLLCSHVRGDGQSICGVIGPCHLRYVGGSR